MSPVIQRCLGISKELSFEEVVKNGTVVVDSDDSALRLIDLKTGNSYEQFPLQRDPYRLSDMHLSPDKTALAYYENYLNADGKLEKAVIWVIDAKADILAQVPLGPNDAGQFRWLDNDHLQIYSNKTYQDGTVEILNPYMGELQQITNDLPNLFQNQYNDLIPWLVEYNHDLGIVVYFGQSNGGKSGPIVWNVNDQKVIWQHPGAGMIDAIPSWSPTKDEVAIVDDSGRLYIINRDGTTNQLPKLETQTNVRRFSWSPDGNLIAFWNADGNFEQSKLMIYDIPANQVTDYCIVADGTSGSDPIWSPDSQKFFTHMRIKKDDGSFGGSTILIDVIQSKVFNISREPKLLEWMNSIP
jgi:Tol biopolymer transport system component